MKLLGLTAAALIALAASTAGAQDYPTKPIRLVVPFSAGGGADSVARIVAKGLGARLGQQVVVENKAGAAGIIGTELVAKAEPDGYTLVLGQSGPISINPGLYKSLPYDPVKDFAPITLTTSYLYVLVVYSGLPARSLKELIDIAKQKPGELNYGTAGIGAANHLVAELFAKAAGISITHVPYRGTNPATAAVLTGEVSLVFSDPFSARPHVEAGKIRALGVTSPEPSSAAPGVPPIAKAGLPGFSAIAWHGILAPAATPPAIVQRLNAEIVKVLQEPETKKTLEGYGADPVGNSPAEFAAFIKEDVAKWTDVARAAGIEGSVEAGK
jgi:tripartite-type tricarboxylate transporter receptor subunit TctC